MTGILRTLIDRLRGEHDPQVFEPIATTAPEFQEAFTKTLADYGEVQVLVRKSIPAGTRLNYLFRKSPDFESMLSDLKASDSVTVSLAAPYPMRGSISNLDEMLTWFRGTEVEISILPNDVYIDVETVLYEDISDADMRGQEVFAVSHPLPYWLPPGDVTTTAYVPNADGTITPGTY